MLGMRNKLYRMSRNILALKKLRNMKMWIFICLHYIRYKVKNFLSVYSLFYRTNKSHLTNTLSTFYIYIYPFTECVKYKICTYSTSRTQWVSLYNSLALSSALIYYEKEACPLLSTINDFSRPADRAFFSWRSSSTSEPARYSPSIQGSEVPCAPTVEYTWCSVLPRPVRSNVVRAVELFAAYSRHSH